MAVGLIAGTSGFRAAVVVDLQNIQAPKTLCTLMNPSSDVRFFSAGEIVYVPYSTYAGSDTVPPSSLVKLTLTQKTSKPIAISDRGASAWDWSPDGKTLAYLAGPQLWLKTGNEAAALVASFTLQPGRSGGWDDQILIRFSPSGRHFVLVNTVTIPNTFQIRRASDGSVVWASPSSDFGSAEFATMAAWARHGDRLYFRDGTGIRTWDPTEMVTTLVAGLKWFHPSISPDGRSIAYSVFDQAAPGAPRFPHVELRDLQSGTAHAVGQPLRYHPFFLTSSVVLYGEADPQSGFPAQRSFALDLRTGQETELPFAFVTDVWPH